MYRNSIVHLIFIFVAFRDKEMAVLLKYLNSKQVKKKNSGFQGCLHLGIG
jgi:hypothetical protein